MPTQTHSEKKLLQNGLNYAPSIIKEVWLKPTLSCASPMASSATTDFMQKFKKVAPLELIAVQTDNGSEFEKHFHLYLGKENIIHFNTYPRSPKQNSEIERFNRTLSDAFIKEHRYLLAYDIDQFNEKLINWLLWYNTRRPHWSLGLISPLRYICNQLSAEKSQRCWTSTSI